MGFLTIDELRIEICSNHGGAPPATWAMPTDTDADADEAGKTRLNKFIDWAQLEVAQLRLQDGRLFRHRELEETNSQALTGNASTTLTPVRAYSANPLSANPYQLAVQTPTLAIHSVRILNPATLSQAYRLEPVRDREEFEQRTVLPGRPSAYAVWGNPLDAEWNGGAPPAFYQGEGAILLTPPPSMTYDGWTLEVRRYRMPQLITGTNANLDNDTDVLDFAHVWDEVVLVGATARAFYGRNLDELGDRWTLRFQQLCAETARRWQGDAEDRDYGPDIEMVRYQ